MYVPTALRVSDCRGGELLEVVEVEQNREFHRYLTAIEVPHVYLESKGSHDMVFWNEYTLKFVEMMFGENN